MGGNVYAASHDNGDSNQRPTIGKIAEYQITDHNYPDQLRVAERREPGRWRIVIGFDQDQVAQAADDADNDKQERVIQASRQGPDIGQRSDIITLPTRPE